jgi:toxin CcdB
MAQFTIYANTSAQTKQLYPYLLELQSNLLSDLSTCVVAPLATVSQYAHVAMTRLTPTITIDGETYLLQTMQLSAIARKQLGKVVGDASANSHEIIAALDFLISGF